MAFYAYAREKTNGGRKLVNVALGIINALDSTNKEKLEAITFLRDTGFGRPLNSINEDDQDGGLEVRIINYSNVASSPVPRIPEVSEVKAV